jgi:hypothetical protein
MHTLTPGYYEGKTLINKQYKVQNVDWHDSRFMVKQVANLGMKEIKWAILTFIHHSVCLRYLTNEVVQWLNLFYS